MSKQASNGPLGSWLANRRSDPLAGGLFEFAEFFDNRSGAAFAVEAGQALFLRRYWDHVEQRSRL